MVGRLEFLSGLKVFGLGIFFVEGSCGFRIKVVVLSLMDTFGRVIGGNYGYFVRGYAREKNFRKCLAKIVVYYIKAH